MPAARPILVAFFISSISSIRLLYSQCQSTCRWPWDCALTSLAVFYLLRFYSTCRTRLTTLNLFGDATGEAISAVLWTSLSTGDRLNLWSQAAASRGYHGTLLCLCLCQLDARGNIPKEDKEGKTLLIHCICLLSLLLLCTSIWPSCSCFVRCNMQTDMVCELTYVHNIHCTHNMHTRTSIGVLLVLLQEFSSPCRSQLYLMSTFLAILDHWIWFQEMQV